MENKKYNATIDIIKYLCAIMIVDSHVRLINIENSFLFDLFRFALYFFHCAFGYYFYKGLLKNGNSVIKKNIRRLIVPLLFWVLIYTLINFYNEVIGGTYSLKEFLLLQLSSLFINGVGFHLWYLVALILYVLIGSYFYKKRKLKTLYILSFVLYIIGLCGSYYIDIGNLIPLISNFIHFEYFTTISRLFLHGLPLFTMGLFISEHDDILMKTSNQKLIVAIVLSFLYSVVEINKAIHNDNVFTNISSLGLFLLTYPFFILCLKYPMNKYNNVGKGCKYLSTFMYYAHPLVRTVLASFFMRLFKIEIKALSMTIMTVIICTIGGFLLYKINNKVLNRICS